MTALLIGLQIVAAGVGFWVSYRLGYVHGFRDAHRRVEECFERIARSERRGGS